MRPRILCLLLTAPVVLAALSWDAGPAPVATRVLAANPAPARVETFARGLPAYLHRLPAPREVPEAAAATPAAVSYENGEADLAPAIAAFAEPTPPPISYEDGGAPPDPVSR